MRTEIKVALIGLDTSHTLEFAKRMQAPDCPAGQRVEGLRAVTCLRFPTPFQNEAGLDARQKQLEAWGIKVTTSFEEAVEGCDAIMIEINDPSLHWHYFEKCASLGKMIFLDKPLADTLINGKKVLELVRQNNIPLFSASALRFVPTLEAACLEIQEPIFCTVYGPLGVAPTGSSVVWYGVHSFEMLQRAMGLGARRLLVQKDENGIVAMVQYAEGRRGVVELNNGAFIYGGNLRTKEASTSFAVDMSAAYTDLLLNVSRFFTTGSLPVTLDETIEVMAMLDAARRSDLSGKFEGVYE